MGVYTYTRVRLPKCWRVSKMNSWPREPVKANCSNGDTAEGWLRMKDRTFVSSDPKPSEGCKTGM